MYILGISAYYHDSAVAIIKDGEILAAVQEERFTRKKHDAGFPLNGINYFLQEAGITLTDLDSIVFYDKPLIKFERLLETYLAYAPKGFRSFLAAMPIWLKEKLFLKTTLKKEFVKIANCRESELPKLLLPDTISHMPRLLFTQAPMKKPACFVWMELVNGQQQLAGRAMATVSN